MLVRGKRRLIRHRDSMGCERIVECVRLVTGLSIVFVFELHHAADRSPCDCARMSFFLGQRECGVGFDTLRFVERIHLTGEGGEQQVTFLRFQDDGIGQGVTYWRLPPEEWQRWLSWRLPVDDLQLVKPFDPELLRARLPLEGEGASS